MRMQEDRLEGLALTNRYLGMAKAGRR